MHSRTDALEEVMYKRTRELPFKALNSNVFFCLLVHGTNDVVTYLAINGLSIVFSDVSVVDIMYVAYTQKGRF